MRVIRKLIRKLMRRRKLTSDLEQELALHRELSIEQGNAIGLGNATLVTESVLDVGRFNLIENLWRDTVLAMRRLRSNPAYGLAATGSLALGIGITTAMFTLLNAVILRPLPYKDSERLVWLTEVLKANSTDELTITPDFLDWRRLNRTFQNLAGLNEDTHIVSGGSQPLEIHSARASASLLPILGVTPVLGRNFTQKEDIAGGESVVIISYRFWRNHLRGDSQVLGKPIRLDDRPYSVVGVLPPDFVFPSDNNVQMITPLAKNEAAELARDGRVLTVIHSVIGRLKPGVTLQQAHADITAIQAHLPVPPFHPTISIKALPLRTFLFGDERLTAAVLVIGSGLFLLVAGANMGNLALSQMLRREREFALRRALGAARSRLISQLVVEYALLVGTAWALGLLLALAIRNALVTMPSYASSLYARLPIDLSVLLFSALLLALIVGLFGLLPAVRASDVHISAAIKTGQSHSASPRHHFRYLSLVAATEIAIVVGLSSTAVLTVRSFWNMRYRDLGIQSQHVAAATLHLSSSRYASSQGELAFINNVLQAVKFTAGIEKAAVSVAGEIPPGSWHAANVVKIEGRPLPAHSRQKALMRSQVVSADYFNILHIPLLTGRLLSDADTSTTPQVAVINHEFARRYFPHDSALGHRLTGDRNGWYTVVGIVGDVKSSGLAALPEPIVYMPYEQTDGQRLRELGLVLRSPLPLAAVGPMLRKAVANADPEQPISSLQTVEDRLDESVARPRFIATLLTGLAALGTVLAMLGIYGLVACQIQAQVRDIAVRKALGAPPSQLVAQTVSSTLIVCGSGLLSGLTLSLAGTRLISSMLFQLNPRDPAVFLGVSGCVLATALAACLLPAIRTAVSDPLSALREI